MGYRYIKSKEYGGYSIQKYNTFLFWDWWSNEYLINNEIDAKKIVEIKNFNI